MSASSPSRRLGLSVVANLDNVENMSPIKNLPVSPVLSIVKVKPLIDAINVRYGDHSIVERENFVTRTEYVSEIKAANGERDVFVDESGDDDDKLAIASAALTQDDMRIPTADVADTTERSAALLLVAAAQEDESESNRIARSHEGSSSVDTSQLATETKLESGGESFQVSPPMVMDEHGATLPPAPPIEENRIHAIPSCSDAGSAIPVTDSLLIGLTSTSHMPPGCSMQASVSVAVLPVGPAISPREEVPSALISVAPNQTVSRTAKQVTKTKVYSSTEPPKIQLRNNGSIAPALAKKTASESARPAVTGSTTQPGTSARANALAAKEAATADRIKKVAELKNKWKEEHELKVNANKSSRQAELNLLKQMTSRASEQRRTLLDRQRTFDDNEKLRHRLLLQEKLADQKKQSETLNRRAQDFRIKANLQKQKDFKASAEAEKLHLAKKKEEEANILEIRRLDHIQMKEANRVQEEEQRRQVAARGAAALEQKEIASELDHAKKCEEIDRIDVRRQHWEDDRSSKEQQRRSRRESLSGRLDAWRSERALSIKLQENEHQCATELLHDRQSDWQALQAYKHDEAASRRQSLAGRLDSWRLEKKQFSEQQEQAEEVRLLERELQSAEIEDIRKHQASLEENRRSSLSQRLEKARIDRDHDQAQEAMRQELEIEARRIASQDQDDVRKNKSMILAARRQVSYLHSSYRTFHLSLNYLSSH